MSTKLSAMRHLVIVQHLSDLSEFELPAQRPAFPLHMSCLRKQCLGLSKIGSHKHEKFLSIGT